MKPALTKEEWDRQRGLVYDVGPEREWSGRPHGLAALCLHGQPFGFTREDVSNLEAIVADYRALEGRAMGIHAMQSPKFSVRLQDIANRIEALLPPEESK